MFRAGGKLLIAGNGGSAADAQHIAAELVGRLNSRQKSLFCAMSRSRPTRWRRRRSETTMASAAPLTFLFGISTSGTLAEHLAGPR